ncbi:MAG: pantoate--beta-alanine ligase [Bacteroidota bacterium]|nr:pantoate--beta-alanine ligase [Sphingobacteriales bacterium]
MHLSKTISGLQQHLLKAAQKGLEIGFVPTMGALHNGHISLIKKALSENDLVVCSIFVNPTQFNQAADLETYPRTPAEDIALLTLAGNHILFHPEVNEMYPSGMQVKSRDLGPVSSIFEGASRPGHFDGVAEVVSRLLNVVKPMRAYFGLKDYQQCMIIKSLVELEHIPVSLVFCPTQREPDGLAMSSRNRRLSPENREQAIVISRTLFEMKDNYRFEQKQELLESCRARLSKSLQMEYLDIVNARTLMPLQSAAESAVALFAGRCGEVRLIDNMLLTE